MGEPLGGQLQSQLMDLYTRNEDGIAAAGCLVRHFCFFQLLYNSSRILGIEIRKQDLHVGLLRPQSDGDKPGNRAGKRNQNDHALID